MARDATLIRDMHRIAARLYRLGQYQFAADVLDAANQLERTRAMTDPEDLDTLGQMLHLGAAYIDDQDETDDAQDIATMQQALALIGGLVAGEVAEQEPVEPD